MNYTDMYINIIKKYGKKSQQLERFKKVYFLYRNNKKIIIKTYQSIMKG